MLDTRLSDKPPPMATATTANREQETPTGKAAGPCVMVLFGAAGDLTKRKLVPALFNLAKAKLLPTELRGPGRFRR